MSSTFVNWASRGANMPYKIFINYRREGSIDVAGRLHDRLAQTFGHKNIFMDVEDIPAGVDFAKYLSDQVAASRVFLAVIGPTWLDAKDEDGGRRIDDPDDFVAIEIKAALARNIRVIPVLVEGARMPRADELPDSLKPLARRQAVELGQLQFGRDVEALVGRVREALNGQSGSLRPRRATAVAGAAAVAVGVAVALFSVGWVGLNQGKVLASVPQTVQMDTSDADNSKAAPEVKAKRKSGGKVEQQRQATAEPKAKPTMIRVGF